MTDPIPSLSPRIERRLRWLLFLIVAAWVFVCTQQDHMSVNPASRYAGMEALVEHGTYAIDNTRLVRSTVDKVQWEGAFYSSKPPLLYTLAAPVYALVITVTGETFASDTYGTVRWMRPFVALLPWLLGLWVWHRLLVRLCPDPATRLWAFAAMSVGGLGTAYASHLDNHSIALVTLLAATAAASSLVRDTRWPPALAAFAGLLGGLAVTFDLGAGPLVGAVGCWVVAVAWLRGERASAIAFMAAGLVAPIAQMAIQYGIAGTIKPFYLIDSAYQYERSYWSRPVEFDALREPPLVYAFHALFGHHGLFSHTPWLALGVPWFFQREERRALDALRLVVGGALVFIVGYYVFKTVNYGGRCVGMRWFLVLHAPLALAAARVVQRNRFVNRRPIVAGALVGVAAVTALTGAINPWEEGFVYALFRALALGSISG